MTDHPLPDITQLTPRQAEYVRLLSQGHTPQEVAQILNVTHSSMRNALANAKQRTGARTTPQLTALYAQHYRP